MASRRKGSVVCVYVCVLVCGGALLYQVRVPGIPADVEVVVAELLPRRLSKDVPYAMKKKKKRKRLAISPSRDHAALEL